MNKQMTDRGCPTEEVWMDYLDANPGAGLVADRAALEQHLEACGECTEQVDELRRFNTMLLRSRVPGLSNEQWQVLDERMEMMGSEYVPPPKIATKVYFGLAMAAAIGLFGVGLYHLVTQPPAAVPTIASSERLMQLPGAMPAQLLAGAVEGQLEIADASGKWRALSSGESLATGVKLRGGGAGDARLVVPGHFEVRVTSGSVVQVLAANGHNTWLRLRNGEVSCTVEKRRPHQQFKVLAGRFRATVVGTEFVVRHRDDAAVSVHVTEGIVRVDEANEPGARGSETTTMVRAGNRWQFAGGHIEFGPIRAVEEAVAKPEVMPAPQAAAQPDPASTDEPADEPSTEPQQAAEADADKSTKTSKARRKLTKRSEPAQGDSEVGDATPQPAPEPTVEPAARKPKVVEIKVPAQWHDKAHEHEVKRLEQLEKHSNKSRDAQEGGK